MIIDDSVGLVSDRFIGGWFCGGVSGKVNMSKVEYMCILMAVYIEVFTMVLFMGLVLELVRK